MLGGVKAVDWARTRQGATVMAIAVAALWVIELVDLALRHSLDLFGVRPWTLSGLVGILFAPLLHFGFAHLAANSVPLFVLGTVLWASDRREFAWATAFAWMCSGAVAWLLTPPGSLVIGASGVVMGWTAYLLVRGVLSRNVAHIAIGLVVAVGYGSMLLGVLPLRAGVSWQGHLGGVIGGVLAAWFLHRRGRPPRR